MRVAALESPEAASVFHIPELGGAVETAGHEASPVRRNGDGPYPVCMTGGFDSTAKLWDVENGCCLRRFEGGHAHWVRAVVLSTDGKRLITGGRDGNVCFWNTESGELLATLRNLDTGVLWTTPADENAECGWLWTDRDELVHVTEAAKERDTVIVAPRDARRAEYIATYNSRRQVMARVGMGGASTGSDFGRLVETHKAARIAEAEVKRLE